MRLMPNPKPHSSPQRAAAAAPPTPSADELPPGTLRLVLDPNHPAGLVRAEWPSQQPDARITTFSPHGAQEANSLRALAIGFLCVQACRDGHQDPLNACGSLTATDSRGSWEIKTELAAPHWLNSLAVGFEGRGADKPNPIRQLLGALPGLLDESATPLAWEASRKTKTFRCREPVPAVHSHQVSGPNLLFRLAGKSDDLPPGTDWLDLARRMEQAKQDEWTLLLTPPEVEADKRLGLFQSYLQNVARECSKLVTRGGVAASPEQALRLARVYVELDTEPPPACPTRYGARNGPP
jgi:hypothetical protein